MAKLGIVYGKGLPSMLTTLFTGSRAYHTIWLTDEYIYDMHLIRRRRDKTVYDNKEVHYYDFPKVTAKYLEDRLTYDSSSYGWKDYMLFALRPLYHLIGQNTRNQNGLICSEMCNVDLVASGYTTLWSIDQEPPSPYGLELWAQINQ